MRTSKIQQIYIRSFILRLCLFAFPFAGLFPLPLFAQETRYFTDPLLEFTKAQEYFQHGDYSLADPIFRDLHVQLRETDRTNRQFNTEELDFYTIVCGLKLNQAEAAEKAERFIELGRSEALVQKMGFHLGDYDFRHQDMRNAILNYEKVDFGQLSNAEIASMKFQQGYAYFNLQQYEKAKPLLNSVRQLPDDPHVLDAQYYYGVIAFRDNNYSDALDAFGKVEKHPEYGHVVPYYISSIYYMQGKKKQALEYAESTIGKGSAVYDPELKQLMGHAYFESRQYEKAIPYLEQTVKSAVNPGRESLYELSYAYYSTGKHAKSTEGFRKLSGSEDSLSQSAMYLLGDAYLKLGDRAQARNAFAFCASNSSNPGQREISRFQYAKLSYELGHQDIALNELRIFIEEYPGSAYNKEARELMVSLLANTNNYREAMTMLGSVKDPSESTKNVYGKVAFGRAMELINDQDLDGADALLDRSLKSSTIPSISGASHFWKGEIAYRQGRVDDAIRSYNAYLASPSAEGDASVSHAQYNLGYCYLRKENYKAASGLFEPIAKGAALRSTELVQDAFMRTADCYFMSRDFTKARSYYSYALTYSWPSADYATYQNALIAGVANGNEKLNILKTFEQKYPASDLVTTVNMEIANTYMGDEKFRDALPYLARVIKSDGNQDGLKPKALLKQGIAWFNLDNNKESLNSYKKLIADYPHSSEANEALENAKAIYVEEGKTSEYVEFLRSANQTVTKDQEDSLAFASVESRYASDPGTALESINSYLRKYPDGQFHQDAENMRAGIYATRKDWKNAAASYARLADQGSGKYLEKSSQQAAHVYYFELQDYPDAERYFALSKSVTGNREQRLDAMRGLLRSQYQQQKWKEAEGNAQELLRERSISTDDKALAGMVVAHSLGAQGRYAEAQSAYREVVAVNKAVLGAEARYRIAETYFQLQDWTNAEKAAFETISKSGSYDYWITKAYILLGDLFIRQKDYFNAKATLQSVVDNCKITELKNEAQEKLDQVKMLEKSGKQ